MGQFFKQFFPLPSQRTRLSLKYTYFQPKNRPKNTYFSPKNTYSIKYLFLESLPQTHWELQTLLQLIAIKPGTATNPSLQRLRDVRTSTPMTGASRPTSPSRTMDEDTRGSRSSTSESAQGKPAINKQQLAKLFDFSAEGNQSLRSEQEASPSPEDACSPETATSNPQPSPGETMNCGSPDEQLQDGSLQHSEDVQGRMMALRHFGELTSNGDLLDDRDEPEVSSGDVTQWTVNPSPLIEHRKLTLRFATHNLLS